MKTYKVLKEFNNDVDGVNVRVEIGTEVDLEESVAEQLLIDGAVELKA